MYDYTLSTVCFDRRLIDEENNQTRYECTIEVVPQINNLTLRSRIEEVALSLSQLLPGVVIGNEHRVSCKFSVGFGNCTVINPGDIEHRIYSKHIYLFQLALTCYVFSLSEHSDYENWFKIS